MYTHAYTRTHNYVYTGEVHIQLYKKVLKI